MRWKLLLNSYGGKETRGATADKAEHRPERDRSRTAGSTSSRTGCECKEHDHDRDDD